MRKYGFLKHSLVDYPGEVCCVIFMPGCNFKCPYCHNKNLEENVSASGVFLSKIFDYLIESASKFTTAACITGGEPTLYPETLLFLVEKLKSFGIKIKVDTNGSNPEQIKILSKYVDYFAMDLKTVPSRYKEICPNNSINKKIIKSINLLQSLPNAFEFRTTLAWDFVDEAVINELGSYMKIDTPWYLQRCRYYKSPTASEEVIEENNRIADVIKLAKKYTNNVFLRE